MRYPESPKVTTDHSHKKFRSTQNCFEKYFYPVTSLLSNLLIKPKNFGLMIYVTTLPLFLFVS